MEVQIQTCGTEEKQMKQKYLIALERIRMRDIEADENQEKQDRQTKQLINENKDNLLHRMRQIKELEVERAFLLRIF